jgi:hypothetical protein
MATTTTNYGFDVPTSSDLVKNGATQIALLGQDIDTFLFRPFTRNAIINGGMDVWQRGTSIAIAAAAKTFASDRFWAARGGSVAGSTVSRQATGDTTNLPFIQYCARVQRDSGNTSTQFISFNQDIETVNSIPLAGRTVTLSFYARAGANFSATSSALPVSIVTGTGTDQSLSSGYTGQATAFSGTATLTTTWQRFTFTGAIAATATQIGIQPYYVPVGTASTNDYFEITGVQLEQGSQATPFTRASGTIQGELAACQRYFTLWASGSAAPIGMGTYLNGTQVNGTVSLPVEMRTAPTLSIVTGTNFYRASSGGAGNDDFNSLTLDTCSTRAVRYYNASEAGGTSGQAAVLTTNNASAFLAFQAEL